MKSTTLALIFVLVAFCAISEAASRSPGRHRPGTDCGCPYLHAPVCGRSGRTHANSCVANCKHDVRSDGIS